jgi:hypothetical protein
MQFDRDRFASALGSSFVIKGAEGGTLDIELVEVSELRERPRQISFSILFLTPESAGVEQGLYDLDHEVLGPMALFLVPVGMEGNRMRLEAVFNTVRDD